MTIYNFLSHHLIIGLIQSIAIAVIMYFLYRFLQWYFTRKIDNTTKLKRKLSRLRYLLIAIYVFCVLKIWISDFSHILTALGLVGAGLVVVNKETIMNFIGSFIIMWRDLFSEGDYIEVQGQEGYIYRLGPLYYTLAEHPPTDKKTKGKYIRVPNATAITTVIINYSQPAVPFKGKIQFKVTYEQYTNLNITELKTTLDKELTDYLKTLNKPQLNTLTSTTISLYEQPNIDKPELIDITIRYQCLFEHKESLSTLLNTSLLQSLTTSDQFKDIQKTVSPS
ncbi:MULTISPECIES: mechanosensitive ion channel family protein [Cysteiniphilum]|uniref:mechanosensitive ion channel family protein n=1 Tax=Cysteiniphilum TaxID=2056696 RepID=UPI00177BCC39|nr:mechanosensitive ion channel domain-containing protein [Cysteiniphilum marinum]